MYLCHSEILMPKDTESLGNNKAPACESRGFVRKIMKVCILTHLHILSTTKTSFGSDDLQKAGTIDLTDCATGWTTHLGSRLKIDDLELIYE